MSIDFCVKLMSWLITLIFNIYLCVKYTGDAYYNFTQVVTQNYFNVTFEIRV